MKNFTKPIKFIIALIAMVATNVLFAQGDYELNLRVTQNDNVIGGTLKVSVEARAVGSPITVGGISATNQKGGILSRLFTNPNAISFSSGTFNPVFSAFVVQKIAASSRVPGRIDIRTESNSDAISATIPTTWLEVAELTFTIVSFDDPLGFDFGLRRFIDNTTSELTHNSLNVFDRVEYTNGAWRGGNGPSGEPATDGSDLCKQLVIRDAVTISAVSPQEYRIDYIDVNFNGELTIGENMGLYPWTRDAADQTVNTPVIIAASATGYGQYRGPEIPVVFQSYWGTDPGWRNMAFPVSVISSFDLGAQMNYDGGSSAICTPVAGGTWGNYVNTTNLYEFTAGVPTTNGVPCAPPASPVEHEWVGLTSMPIGGANGYDIYWSNFFNPNGLVTVEGTSIESTTYNYTQSSPHASGSGSQALQSPAVQASWDGWRIIANPFTCALDVSAWASDNGVGAASIHIYDRSTGNMVVAPASIAPGQAFWFKDASNATLNFDTYRHGLSKTAPALTKTIDQEIALVMEAGKQTSTVSIRFADNATGGFDAGIDAFFRKDIHQANSSSVAFEVQNNDVGPTYLQINAVAAPEATERLPIAVDIAESGNVQFNSEQLNVSGVDLAIEDLETAPGVLHNIVGKSYTTYVTPNSGYGRFVVHMNAGKTDNIEGEMADALNAWFNGDILMLEENYANASVQVYNLAGQLVATGPASELIIVDKPGVYVIQVVTEKGNEQRAKVVKL
jgi:hypothetical protein